MSSNRDNKAKEKKKVVIFDTRPLHAAATPKAPIVGKSGIVKKGKDPAPGSLSVWKGLTLETSMDEKKLPRRNPKDEETSTDDETEEEALSSEASGDQDGAEVTEEFATVIRGPPTVKDGEDVAEETDEKPTKKRKRSHKSPAPVQKSARKEGQIAPTRKVSIDTADSPPPSAATVKSDILKDFSDASRLKKNVQEPKPKALLLANAKRGITKLEKYEEVTDSDLDAPAPPLKKKEKDEARTAKDGRKEKEKRKGKKKRVKSKARSSDVDMDEGKQREAAPTKREKQLEAEIEKLRKRLAKQKGSSDDSSHSSPDSSATDSDEGSEDREEDAKRTKKFKEPPKKTKAATVRRVSRDDPKVFSYYKAQSRDIRALAQSLKAGCARSVFLNWWPEEAERAIMGEEAYDEALEEFRSVIVISSSDEEFTSKQKAKQRRKAPFKYDHNVQKMVSNFPTEFRNTLRNSVVDSVENAYEIRHASKDFTGTAAEYTRDRVGYLLDDYTFAKDPKDPHPIIGSNPVFIKLMMKHFGKGEYMRQSKTVQALRPMPVQCIAIMVTAIYYCLDRFSDGGVGRKMAFHESIYKGKYNEVVNLLTEAQKANVVKYTRLMDAYSDAMPATGANSSKWCQVTEEFKAKEEPDDD